MRKKIKKHICSMADSKGIKVENNTNLYESGVLDSLGIIMLLSFLQDEFSIEFNLDDMDFNNYKCIDVICAWVENTLNK